MKRIQTNRTHTFENWRVNNIDKYGIYIWPQLNYTTQPIAISNIVFEEKQHINLYLDNFISKYIKGKYTYKKINLTDKTSNNYVSASSLASLLNLKLSNNCDREVCSYWDYRIITRPVNCITADIDSLEIFGNIPIGIEAAQLYNTSNLEESIQHIYRTFAYRKNKVNPYQYGIQEHFMHHIGGKSFILFHKISDNEVLMDTDKILLIENNNNFTNMLYDIYNNISVTIYNNKYYSYLKENLKLFNNIYEGYDYIKQINK